MATVTSTSERSLRPPTGLELLLNSFASETTINIRKAHSTIEVGSGQTKNAITTSKNGTSVSFFIHTHGLIDEASALGIRLTEVPLDGRLYNEHKYATTDVTALLKPENEAIVAKLVRESVTVLKKKQPA